MGRMAFVGMGHLNLSVWFMMKKTLSWLLWLEVDWREYLC